jgi:hypothetical protein
MAERTRVLEGGVPQAAQRGLNLTPANVVRQAGRGVGKLFKSASGFLVAPAVGQQVGEYIGGKMSTPEATGNTQAIGTERGALNGVRTMGITPPAIAQSQEQAPSAPQEPQQAPYAASQTFDEDTMQQIVDFINRNQMQSPSWQAAQQTVEQSRAPQYANPIQSETYQPSQHANPLIRFASRLGDSLTNGRQRFYQDESQNLQNEALANQINIDNSFQPADRMALQAYLQQATGTDLGNASMAQAVPGQQVAAEQNQRNVAGMLAGQAMQQPVGPDMLQQLLQASGIDAAQLSPEQYSQLLEYFMTKAAPLASIYGNLGDMGSTNPLDQVPINR